MSRWTAGAAREKTSVPANPIASRYTDRPRFERSNENGETGLAEIGDGGDAHDLQNRQPDKKRRDGGDAQLNELSAQDRTKVLPQSGFEEQSAHEHEQRHVKRVEERPDRMIPERIPDSCSMECPSKTVAMAKALRKSMYAMRFIADTIPF